MIRAVLFALCFVTSLLAATLALPRLIDKSHLEQSLSLALNADVTMQSHEDFRLWPAPSLLAKGIQINPSRDSRDSREATAFGLTSADSIHMQFSWLGFGLTGLAIDGGLLKPDVSSGRLEALAAQIETQTAQADIQLTNTVVEIFDDAELLSKILVKTAHIKQQTADGRRIASAFTVNGQIKGLKAYVA